ncbi:MAG TPA: hypothetical protein DIT07_01305 [Sphingobacteriaceae bacterium]|nr:hypothetical protein [Sphingobacteriaceae bacterium]
MINLVDVIYYCHDDLKDPHEVIEKHKPGMGYLPFIKEDLNVSFIKHLDYEGIHTIDGVKYGFFKSNNKFWHIPFKTHRFIKRSNPDLIIVQGLIFPLQVIALKLALGNKCAIVVQHHGESPFKGLKIYLQKLADHFISGYLFTATGISQEWIDKGIIKDPDKCFEILPASTSLSKQEKDICKEKSGLNNNQNFIWVGRLNSNKDPFCVLTAFENYLNFNPDARLYMIYQTEELLNEIKDLLSKKEKLSDSVQLVGKIPNSELQSWLSAADFYISASHKEGCGYALLEAMACGCIPVVTDIPSFRKITDDGKYGFLYPPGDPDILLRTLVGTDTISKSEISNAVVDHFNNKLSYKCIADDLHDICKSLSVK